MNLFKMPSTNFEDFVDAWEPFLSKASPAELKKYLADTSPHHPNQNMIWLHDRILYILAFKLRNGE